MERALVLLALLFVAAMPAACEDDLQPGGATASSQSGGTSTSLQPGASAGGSDWFPTTSSTSLPLSAGGGATFDQARIWGPVPLTVGWLDGHDPSPWSPGGYHMTIENGIGVVQVQALGGRSECRVYAVDLDDGSVIGELEADSSQVDVDICGRYLHLMPGTTSDAISALDLTRSLALADSWNLRLTSDFGTYFYVRPGSGETDYLIDKETLALVSLEDVFGAHLVSQDHIYELLYPDCVIGEFYDEQGRSTTDAHDVFSLREDAIIGHIPSGSEAFLAVGPGTPTAWDPGSRLLFGESRFADDRVFAFGIEDGRSTLSSLNEGAGALINQGLWGGSGPYKLDHTAMRVIPDIEPTGAGFYVLNGFKRWYALDLEGRLRFSKRGNVVGEHGTRVLVSWREGDYYTLMSVGPDGSVVWERDWPRTPMYHADDPFCTEDSILWRGESFPGDVLLQWDYETGSYVNYTQFPGKEIQVLSAIPLIVAERDAEQRREESPWSLNCYDPGELPFNLIPDIEVAYDPNTVYAGITEVTFTCSVSDLPVQLQPHVTFEWEVNGTRMTGNPVTQIFPEPGTYDVTVWARVGDSLDTATETVQVKVIDIDFDITATYDPHEIYAGVTEVTFTCAPRGLPPELLDWVTYEWDVSGTKLTGAEVTTVLDKAGKQTVTVSASIGTPAHVVTKSLEVLVLSVVRLIPLYPSDPETPSSIMRGGKMYRYYKVVDGDGQPVEGVAFRYRGPFYSVPLTATSNSLGELALSFNVPRSTEPGHFDSTLTIESVWLGRQNALLQEAPDFATDVLPLSWSTNWMMGNGMNGTVGVEVFVSAEEAAGMVLTRTEADPANGGNGSMAIGDSISAEAALGLQAEVGEFKLLTSEGDAAGASIQASAGAFADFATLFDEPSECSISEKLMAALTLLIGVQHAASGGQTAVLAFAQSALASALSEDVQLDHTTGGMSLGLSADVSVGSLDLVSKKPGSKDKTSFSGVALVDASAGFRYLLSATLYPGSGELSGTAGLEFGSSISLVDVLGFSLLDAAGAPLPPWLNTSCAFSAEAVTDPLDLSLERLVLTVAAETDSSGCQEMRLTIDDSVAGSFMEALALKVAPLVPGEGRPGLKLLFGKDFCDSVIRLVLNSVISAKIPYEHVVTMDETPTSLNVGLGLSIAGVELSLAVNPTWGRYNSYAVERGLFVVADPNGTVGRTVRLEEYPSSLFDSQVDELPDVLLDLLEVVEDIAGEAWDAMGGFLSSSLDTVLEVGGTGKSALGGAGKVVIEGGTELLEGLLSSSPSAQLALYAPGRGDEVASVAAVRSKDRVTLIGAPSGDDGFTVGGTYLLEPEAATLSKPATLTLSYSAEAAAGRDPATFSIYHYDPAGFVWTPVECVHDRATRTLTAEVTEMGAYCIGSDGEAPEFTLVMPAGAPAVVTTARPQLTVGCVETGSGLLPESFTATLDGRAIEGEWLPVARRATLTVTDPLAAGMHTLSVEGTDGAGNRGSATFDIEVKLPPGQAVLRLRSATSEEVELEVEAGPGDASTAAYEVWRSDPDIGVTYEQVGIVEADSGVFTDKGTLPGETYRYVAVASSDGNVKGAMSEILTVEVPQKPTSETTAVTTATTTEVTISATTTEPGSAGTTVATEAAGSDDATGAAGDGISGGALAGIIIGVVAAVGAAVGGVIFARRKRW